jgi:glycolate oxidase iron-sulfur subunit
MDTIDPHDLATCVRCGLCLSACPTFQLTGMEGYSPRGRIAAVRSLDTPTARLSPVVTEYLDTCLGCLACEAVCPSGVPYGRILEGARAEVRPAGIVRRVVDAVLLWIVARRWRLSLATLPLWALQRTGLLRLLARGSLRNVRGLPGLRLGNLAVRMGTNYVPPPDVEQKGQVVLFAGCVQDAWARDVHFATIDVFTRAGYRVRIPRGVACCGALHAHAGHVQSARRLARRNIDPLEEFAGDIVVTSAGCGAALKSYGHLEAEAAGVAERTRDWSEILRAEDIKALGASPPPGLERIAVHDPCHLGFAQGIRTQPRDLLRACGYEVVDLPDGGRCCGAAGTYALHHPDWAAPLRAQKLEACAATGADAVAVANPGCQWWMGAPDGAPRMYHPVQLVAVALANARSHN